MASIVISENELLEALRGAAVVPDEPPPGTMTLRQLQVALKLSRCGVQRALVALREQGRLTTYRVRQRDSLGRQQVVLAYGIAPAVKPAKARKRA